jgi:glycosyltransferase involved in cell wall biosynthesis
MLKKRSFDLFHPTYYDPYFLEYLRGKPFVLTVHDMIHEKFANEFLRLKNKVILQKKELIKKARHIIAISESTKKDIIDIYQIPESKISVVYLGYKQIANNCFHESNFPDKYILYVGDRALYKNFQFFLKSISSYLKMEEDLYLVCVGGREFTYDEKELINKFELASKMIHYPKVSDDFIRAAYQNALGFIFPSLYEGFGLPVLEAFVNGCPAVLSNTSSLPEVGGDAALYFDPRNSESILESVRKIVTDIKLREELKQRGYSRLKKFSWQKCAEETKQVYQSII